jgi:hypothetical protein
VLCSSQDHLRTGMCDLDHPVLVGVENIDKALDFGHLSHGGHQGCVIDALDVTRSALV